MVLDKIRIRTILEIGFFPLKELLPVWLVLSDCFHTFQILAGVRKVLAFDSMVGSSQLVCRRVALEISTDR